MISMSEDFSSWGPIGIGDVVSPANESELPMLRALREMMRNGVKLVDVIMGWGALGSLWVLCNAFYRDQMLNNVTGMTRCICWCGRLMFR